MKTAVFPGSFDPFTIGHQSIIDRTLPLFDKIIIGLGVNLEKNFSFPLDKRIEWIKSLYKNEPKIMVANYSGLTIKYCEKVNAQYIIRGLRNASDFDFEKGIAQMNRAMSPQIETMFIISLPELSAISSSIIRDIHKNGGSIKQFIPYSIT